MSDSFKDAEPAIGLMPPFLVRALHLRNFWTLQLPETFMARQRMQRILDIPAKDGFLERPQLMAKCHSPGMCVGSALEAELQGIPDTHLP